jgi:hypothetical protein
VIRQVKEYQRRGPLLRGVVLRKDRSIVSAIAVEPDFRRTLPWLDPSVADDRFLASTLENREAETAGGCRGRHG